MPNLTTFEQKFLVRRVVSYRVWFERILASIRGVDAFHSTFDEFELQALRVRTVSLQRTTFVQAQCHTELSICSIWVEQLSIWDKVNELKPAEWSKLSWEFEFGSYGFLGVAGFFPTDNCSDHFLYFCVCIDLRLLSVDQPCSFEHGTIGGSRQMAHLGNVLRLNITPNTMAWKYVI